MAASIADHSLASKLSTSIGCRQPYQVAQQRPDCLNPSNVINLEMRWKSSRATCWCSQTAPLLNDQRKVGRAAITKVECKESAFQLGSGTEKISAAVTERTVAPRKHSAVRRAQAKRGGNPYVGRKLSITCKPAGLSSEAEGVIQIANSSK